MSGTGRRAGQFPTTVPNLWISYLVIGAIAIGVSYLIPNAILGAVIFEVIGLSAVAALIVGVRLHQPVRRTAWYLMAAGLGLWAIADAIGNWWALVRDVDQFPTPADPVYLLGYVIVTAGFTSLIRGRQRGRDTGGLLDSLILTASLAALSWVLLARPILQTYADSALAAAVAISYPAADIVLAGLVIRLLTTPSGRTRSYRLLVLALVALIVADMASSALKLLTFEENDPLNFLWMASYLAWGAAALDPSMVSLSAPAASTSTRFTRKRLAALTVAVLIAPVTLGIQLVLGFEPTIWAAIIFSIIAFLLVVARMNLSIQQIQAANAEVAAAQDELSHQAAHDPLTGLANRAQAMRLVSGALGRAQRSGAVVGLLFVDLDGFKQVNDTLGHQAGDEVLCTVAERMQDAVRAGDVVARLGGDEFLVLLEPLDEQPSAMTVAERIIAVIAEPMVLHSGHQARIGASVGLAISQDAGTDADRLVQEADLAVYRAKAAGRGRIEVFDRSLRDRLRRRTHIEESILAALAEDTVELALQPIVELITGELAGLEARSRCHVGEDLFDRTELIADLGRSPAIVELDAWTLRWATRAVFGLGEQPLPVVLAVPLTIQHLLQDRIRDDVTRALAGSGLPASRLVLVLSASELTDDLRLHANLDVLRERGVRVCLDGFGAGAATNQLLQLPVSMVRLDEVLLQLDRPKPTSQTDPAGAHAPSSVQVLRLTVQTARAFGYQVVAPRVDDTRVLAAATEVGCDFGQGPAATDLLPDERAIDYLIR